MAEVSIREIRKAFGATQILHGVNVEVADGEFVILVGPSGCGKSTLLRMIAGLENVTSGEVAIGGRVVNNVPPKERDIAMVFQNYALYPHMTVRENMAFSLSLAKAPKTVMDQKVGRAADILGLAQLLDRYPRQLSGGQRQRVAMGRAIVRDPQVFLFDEPLSNLDAKLRVQMRGEIKDLHQRLGTTTVYVTHDQIEAMTMADKIVVMQGGHVEQIGAPLDLYDRPANLFVAGFIGSPAMNFLKGKVVDGGVAIGDLSLDLPHGSRAQDGMNVVYGIRPEHWRLDDAGIPSTVRVVEPTGSETLVVADLADHRVVCAFRERVQAHPGETLRISPNLDAAHLFDEASGIRLA
jgi:multiple sugar transport system ATP-binding protein